MTAALDCFMITVYHVKALLALRVGNLLFYFWLCILDEDIKALKWVEPSAT